GAVIAMAASALPFKKVLRSWAIIGVFSQRTRPGYVIGVYIQQTGLGIESAAAPLSAAIEAGKDNCVLADAERNKLGRTAEFAEALKRPLVRLGRAVREHVLGEALARERSRFGGKRLGRR